MALILESGRPRIVQEHPRNCGSITKVLFTPKKGDEKPEKGNGTPRRHNSLYVKEKLTSVYYY